MTFSRIPPSVSEYFVQSFSFASASSAVGGASTAGSKYRTWLFSSMIRSPYVSRIVSPPRRSGFRRVHVAGDDAAVRAGARNPRHIDAGLLGEALRERRSKHPAAAWLRGRLRCG